MSLAKVKPWKQVVSNDDTLYTCMVQTVARYRHIWRVYRAAMAYVAAHNDEWPGNRELWARRNQSHDALTAACEAARKAGVK